MSQLTRKWSQQRGMCIWCGRQTVLPKKRRMAGFKPRAATRDHILPRSKGGGNDWQNIVCACYKCNTDRGDDEKSYVPNLEVLILLDELTTTQVITVCAK